ncbi:serine/threonine-protein kinase fray2 isoform X2 [Benincasa hispida]|uniref:serine/threonine-protein kinase fray2 isoform X2 n=1 Tax=Benincasa hispida TaxID=102211 RepID=UPI0018FF8E36|nr:serine/threonine-protein kinase fray2 isoform X2 [Benincasa hispida]XP_038895541.1 serine/threonine-protein kinase fray2 isoform X2 [Benincasa hispida]
MEESKAAAYYDELTRKGEGAARFKRGLGFSASDSNSDVVSASKGSALPSSSSFLSSFVKASSPSKASEFEKQAQLEAIQNKLKKKKPSSPEGEERRPRALERDRRKSSPRRRSLSKERERHSHSRRRSSSRDRERHSRRRSRSRDRYGDTYRDRDRERRRRSRSRSNSDRDRRRRRSRSLSLERKKLNGSKGGGKQKDRKVEGQKTEGVDYSRLIEGYDMMSPAERVKAKMKLQLAETARTDDTKGTGPGWERFEFNKDAPLDDEEIEAAEDDATLVKHIGQSFRFSAIEARKEEQIKAAHDEAMFGAPVGQLLSTTNDEDELGNEKSKELCDSGVATSLLSEKIIAKQQGSWRDRARKV